MSHWCNADANPATTISLQSTLQVIKLFALTAYFGPPIPTISNSHHTHPLSYANFATKPIVEYFSTIFTHSPHPKRMPLCLMMQKIFATYFIAASCHGKNYHFFVTTNQPPQYMTRMSCAPHQNHHILLARTNHHCFLVLYFCTTLPY